jgi:hypothetical protein
MRTKIDRSIGYFTKNIFVVVGLVFMWRGVWYILDFIDLQLFGGNHAISAVAGIFIGLFILYLPDRDLKEISQL